MRRRVRNANKEDDKDGRENVDYKEESEEY